jgi:hypothetical protein
VPRSSAEGRDEKPTVALSCDTWRMISSLVCLGW